MIMSIGISFNLIIIRVDKGIAVGENSLNNTQGHAMSTIQFISGRGARSDVEETASHDVHYQTSSDKTKGAHAKGAWGAV